MADATRKPYDGLAKRLVISIDVGTTYSAASFCILQPGKVPKFEEVLRWARQVTPDGKVPSVVYYDSNGNPKAFGAETDNDDMLLEAEMQQWTRAEWWKMHLRPSHLPLVKDLVLKPLTGTLTADDIFSHYLGYVKEQLQEYISTVYADGPMLWTSLYSSLSLVLTTPNGWEGRQQGRMRQAAINADLVDAGGSNRVRFVTEAEAAILYSIESGCIGSWLVPDANLVLCDCGGGTIDIIRYQIQKIGPLRLQESAASRCYLAGAVFVTQAFDAYIRVRLKDSQWDNPESIAQAVKHFDRNAKKIFADPSDVSWVQLDGFKSVAELGVLRGRLRIPGEDMASLFAASLKAIKEGLEIAIDNQGQVTDNVILVGGLASSPYIYSEISRWARSYGISVSRPDGPMTKAVANGALAWHIDDVVTARVSKNYYGIEIITPYDHADPAHVERAAEAYISYYKGTLEHKNLWSTILTKGHAVASTKEFVQTYHAYIDNNALNFQRSYAIYAYRGSVPPKFMTLPGQTDYMRGFDKICTVNADLRTPFMSSPKRRSPHGSTWYREVSFDICLIMGGTELSARIRWQVGTGYHYGPATVAYD
ncbi:hypothetical protein PUNSTDRAFT_108180 [Punctularia strigosozonata HHB-11173 SS5]|uniref:Actin-like ATPase domain-containing protein n=1 Tax=Punctularia strigosozonata (strain HHB-11173) TaxID=741275 RepID=R7S3J1_PUNST|nr:uncharacterized protein PUNSTDRAFT_108180 [Punctularia strigosozonata HHB-11173 SS5]EIN04434.1 hypothetical protein PUNSTDRAFT_108180 [Punctularia strigosozonata HHB-11173 SS5]